MARFDDMKRWLRDERGATAIEYGLIVALVTIVLIVGLTSFGDKTVAMYDYISSSVTAASNRS